MSEGSVLVNAGTRVYRGLLESAPQATAKWPRSRGNCALGLAQSGRTVALMLKLEAANG